VQTVGRAARNVNGEVVMYADQITGSIERAIRETDRRRVIQLAYNEEHHITPTTIIKKISDILIDVDAVLALEMKPVPKSKKALEALIKDKERDMREAAKHLDFELAALLRDEIKELYKKQTARAKAAEKEAKEILTKSPVNIEKEKRTVKIPQKKEA
jgi:excinuclease ABC subunit B